MRWGKYDLFGQMYQDRRRVKNPYNQIWLFEFSSESILKYVQKQYNGKD